MEKIAKIFINLIAWSIIPSLTIALFIDGFWRCVEYHVIKSMRANRIR